MPDELIAQAVKHIVMHEVGHTLGLRHNFKASAMLSLKDINTPEVTRKKGMVGSVMDYSPANLAPHGEKQGEYFSTMLGPYDYWAIEYAYKPISGSEKDELAKIAKRVAEPDLAYATDEDLYNGNPDPRINTFDLGDPLEFAEQRIEFVHKSVNDLSERVVVEGEGWQRARSAFSLLLGELAQACSTATQYVGAQYTYRDHRGDPNARNPMELVPVEKQRKAIALVQEKILSDKAFEFPPELIKRLAPEYWGDSDSGQYEYPVYDQILALQNIVLSSFLDPDVLMRLQQAELSAAAGEDLVKMPEVFAALTDSIWTELPSAGLKEDAEAQKIQLSTSRRNLQREHVKRLAQIVLGPQGGRLSLSGYLFSNYAQPAPADARSLARLHLRNLDARMARALKERPWNWTTIAELIWPNSTTRFRRS